MGLFLMTVYMAFVVVRSEITATIFSSGVNNISLLQFENFLKDKQVIYKVKGEHDANLMLFLQNRIYTVHVGAWGNRISQIGRSDAAFNEKTHVRHYENGIMSSYNYREFWLSWKNGFIRAGKGNSVGQEIIMTLEVQCLYAVKDITIYTSHGATVTWIFQPPSDEYAPNNKLNMTAMFQEIENCPLLQILKTITVPNGIRCVSADMSLAFRSRLGIQFQKGYSEDSSAVLKDC